MTFVADDPGAWLVGLLADASRKKLMEFVLGTDQERALRSAATAAVRFTAEKLCPDDDEQTEHLAFGDQPGIQVAGTDRSASRA